MAHTSQGSRLGVPLTWRNRGLIRKWIYQWLCWRGAKDQDIDLNKGETGIWRKKSSRGQICGKRAQFWKKNEDWARRGRKYDGKRDIESYKRQRMKCWRSWGSLAKRRKVLGSHGIFRSSDLWGVARDRQQGIFVASGSRCEIHRQTPQRKGVQMYTGRTF